MVKQHHLKLDRCGLGKNSESNGQQIVMEDDPRCQYIFQDFCFGVSWTSWGTRFQVGMTADQRRYLRSDE